MDLSTVVGYLETLALIYGWTIVVALLFRAGERLFGREPDPPRTPAGNPVS